MRASVQGSKGVHLLLGWPFGTRKAGARWLSTWSGEQPNDREDVDQDAVLARCGRNDLHLHRGGRAGGRPVSRPLDILPDVGRLSLINHFEAARCSSLGGLLSSDPTDVHSLYIRI